jgi:hypothetical protein
MSETQGFTEVPLHCFMHDARYWLAVTASMVRKDMIVRIEM